MSITELAYRKRNMLIVRTKTPDSLCIFCCHGDFRGSLVFHAFSGGRTLQILNAQEDSAGRYSCIATNEAGEVIKHYEVKVYSKS